MKGRREHSLRFEFYNLTYLFVLVEELCDKSILPHDLPPQDGVEAGDVPRLARHHLEGDDIDNDFNDNENDYDNAGDVAASPDIIWRVMILTMIIIPSVAGADLQTAT